MSHPAKPTPWWRPDRHADRRPFLQARARIKSAIRAWFADQGFLHVFIILVLAVSGYVVSRRGGSHAPEQA